MSSAFCRTPGIPATGAAAGRVAPSDTFLTRAGICSAGGRSATRPVQPSPRLEESTLAQENPEGAPLPEEAPRGGAAAAPPAPAALAALRELLGADQLTVAAPPGRPPRRVWRLRASGGGRAWFLKSGPHPLEVSLLAHLAGRSGPPVPAVAAVLLPGTQGPRAVRPQPDGAEGAAPVAAICLEEVPGLTLGRALHAGSAIPVAAWGRALAQLHAVPPPATGPLGLPPHPEPEAEAARLLPQLAALGGEHRAADAGTLIAQSLSALPALAARAAAELGGEPRVLCHGALWPEHVLVLRGEVVGLLDWEHARLAPPALDLAEGVLGLFSAGISARAALALGDALSAAYRAAGEQPLPGLGYHLAMGALTRLAAAVRRRARREGGAEVQAWAGMLALCLRRAGA